MDPVVCNNEGVRYICRPDRSPAQQAAVLDDLWIMNVKTVLRSGALMAAMTIFITVIWGERPLLQRLHVGNFLVITLCPMAIIWSLLSMTRPGGLEWAIVWISVIVGSFVVLFRWCSAVEKEDKKKQQDKLEQRIEEEVQRRLAMGEKSAIFETKDV